MYTTFPFEVMIGRTMESVTEAFDFERERNPPPMSDGQAPPQLHLGLSEWSYEGDGFSKAQVEALLTHLVTNNFTCNGGKVRRQIKGMPMGMPVAPQIANLASYPVEKAHAYALGPGNSLVVCRYIDDLYSAGVPLPPQEAYGMEYKTTAEGESVESESTSHRRMARKRCTSQCTTGKRRIRTISSGTPSSALWPRRSNWVG